MSLHAQIDDIMKKNSSESEKENRLRNLLISISPSDHTEDDLIKFRNYYWSKQATQPHTVIILQVIADELDRRSLIRQGVESAAITQESIRLNMQSNNFAKWALIIAAVSFVVSILKK